MLLITKDLTVPRNLQVYAKYSTEFINEFANPTDNIMMVQPKHLVPLEETDWPDNVKAEIAKIFKEIGVPEPMKQKLVEPYAKGFGGVVDDSKEYKLENVNWELVIYYFKWEAATWSYNTKEIDKLEKVCMEKYGFTPFWHYGVYEDPYKRY